MVKYFLLICSFGILTTLMFEQPSCSASANTIKNMDTDYPFEEMGRQIKLTRESKSLSQVELAKLTNINIEKVKTFEVGEKRPSKEQLYALEKILQTTIFIE